MNEYVNLYLLFPVVIRCILGMNRYAWWGKFFFKGGSHPGKGKRVECRCIRRLTEYRRKQNIFSIMRPWLMKWPTALLKKQVWHCIFQGRISYQTSQRTVYLIVFLYKVAMYISKSHSFCFCILRITLQIASRICTAQMWSPGCQVMAFF